MNVQIRHCKTFHCPLGKNSLYYQTVIDQRLTVFHLLFSCTSIGSSKSLIDKLISSQGIPGVPCVPVKNSITNFFSNECLSQKHLIVVSVPCGIGTDKALLWKWTNIQRRTINFCKFMIMGEPLSLCCGSIILSIRLFDILSLIKILLTVF